MANRRTFKLQRCKANGIALGGVTTFEDTMDHQVTLVGEQDGSVFKASVDHIGKFGRWSLVTTDVSKILNVLTANDGSVFGYQGESGAATFGKALARLAKVTQWTLRFPKNQDATLSLSGVLYGSEGDDIEDMRTYDSAITESTMNSDSAYTFPSRTYRPHSLDFGDINPLHCEELTVSASANVIMDVSDNELVVTACDIIDWNPVQYSLVFLDGSEPTSGYDMATAVIKAGMNDLVATLLARQGGSARTFTGKSVKFKSVTPSRQGDYTKYTLAGEAQGRTAAGAALTYASSPTIIAIA